MYIYIYIYVYIYIYKIKNYRPDMNMYIYVCIYIYIGWCYTYPSGKKMGSSIGMMTLLDGKSSRNHVPNQEPV